MNHDLETIAATLVASGKSILAADETVPTLTRWFDTLGIQSTEETRRTLPRNAIHRGGRSGINQRCNNV